MTKLEKVKKLAVAQAKRKSLQDFEIKKSDREKSKYMVKFTKAGSTHKVYFGHPDYKDFLDTGDVEKRTNYLNRATKIRDSQGKLTCNNPLKSNFWAVHVLWPKS